MPANRRAQTDPDSLLPLTPAIFHILLALADGASHGYAIVQEIARLTNGRLSIGEGTLYRSTERMLAQGLIDEVHTREARLGPDARRRTYRLTPWGLAVARAEAERVVSLAKVVIARGLVRRKTARSRLTPAH